MSLKAMPIWMYHGVQDDYQFSDVVKPENLTRLPPLNEQEVSASVYLGETRPPSGLTFGAPVCMKKKELLYNFFA